MPFIELTTKQRRALLNELIDEASDAEMLGMVRHIITRSNMTLPATYKERVLMHAQKTFKVSTTKKVATRGLPAAVDEDDFEDEE